MIEKIPDQIPVQTGEWRGTTFDIIPKETFGMACRKINELVDAVNELQKHEEQHLDLLTELNETRLHQNKESAEAESVKLQNELDRTRKALEIAVDALKDNLSQANFREMLDASRFHCIRTKCESALAEITALEQKD